MNKQLLVDYTVFEVTPQAINESLTQNNGKLIVSGVTSSAAHMRSPSASRFSSSKTMIILP